MRKKIKPIKNPLLSSAGKFTGIILAGGKGTRFGFNKTQIKIGVIPLFIDQVFKLNDFCSEIIIATSERNRLSIISELGIIERYISYYNWQGSFDMSKIKVLNDDTVYAAAGSIIGLYTGLKNAENDFSIVLASDMPFISKRLINILLYGFGSARSKTDGRIIETEKGFEVLCGLYGKSCLEAIHSNILKANFKISDIFSNINVEIIGREELNAANIDDLNFFNINSLEDYYIFNDIWNKSIEKSCIAGSKRSNSYAGFRQKWERFYLR